MRVVNVESECDVLDECKDELKVSGMLGTGNSQKVEN
jgi:hypothetical protein